ncbi:hypothetical protein Micbo1qcDRAFT_200244 [Microdochium bolleyi]|uniref:Uncharacterized protein n=1 Tax=Microdochium bolleyi TaxID=196109 RepID=A0A136JKA4_9PEZI|nr:hypothetical protein Micbo1qcDRAFT_200244 [Microdochium bolleyi]
MKVDPPETAVPSTPPASSDHRPEPVSNRVTINLRNGNDPRSSSTSPSPTEPRMSRSAGVSNSKPPVVKREARGPLTGPASVVGSPEHPVVIVDDGDDNVVEMVELTDSSRSSPPDLTAQLLTALATFPYVSGPDDSSYASLQRLQRYLSQAPEAFETFLSACGQNQDFWLELPDLFAVIWER